MSLTLLHNCNRSGVGLLADMQSIADLLTSSHPQMSASHLLGLQGPQQTQLHVMCMTLLCYFSCSGVRLLADKTPVWTKSLKSGQLKLHKSVNNKKSACFIIEKKISRNFKCPKMAQRQAKISNSNYSYWIREGFSILKKWKSQKIQKFGNPEYLNPGSFSNSESRKS